MEESLTTSPLPVSEKPTKSQIESKQLNQWQNKLLPWLVIMPTLLILLFIYLATRQMQQFNAVIDARTESSVERILTAPSDPALDSRLKGDMDYVRWVTLARMEEKSLDRRYNKGGLLLASRIFTKYLGFFTGMILAIVGVIFIIGKLQESSADIEGAVGDQMKLKIVSSSPGIIFGVLGTVLMLSTILQHAVIELKDQPLFLNSYNIQVNSVDKGLPVATPADNNTNSALMDSLLKAKP